MENQVLTSFFFFGGQHGKILLVDMVASKKKKKVNTWFSILRTVLLQIFSNFNEGQGQAVQIKDCPLK